MGYDGGRAFEGPLPGDATLGVHGFAVVMTHLNLWGDWNIARAGGLISKDIVEVPNCKRKIVMENQNGPWVHSKALYNGNCSVKINELEKACVWTAIKHMNNMYLSYIAYKEAFLQKNAKMRVRFSPREQKYHKYISIKHYKP